MEACFERLFLVLQNALKNSACFHCKNQGKELTTAKN